MNKKKYTKAGDKVKERMWFLAKYMVKSSSLEINVKNSGGWRTEDCN